MRDVWDIARLNQLISSRSEESLNLEYKSSGALDDRKRHDITKDISAMANSDGGTIIYGIAEDPANRHLPGKLDPIDRTQFSKEWLEHVASNIQPRIDSLKILPVAIPPDPNHVVYIVEVPKATTAHQAQDLKYYRRYNFECQAMPDYQIRELMNRQKIPTVSVSANLLFHADGGSLVFKIDNTSEVLAKDFTLVVWTPMMWNGKPFAFVEEQENPIVSHEFEAPCYKAHFHNANEPPLFPKSTATHAFRFRFPLAMNPKPKTTIKEIRYALFADSMPFVKGTFNPDQIIAPVKLLN